MPDPANEFGVGIDVPNNTPPVAPATGGEATVADPWSQFRGHFESLEDDPAKAAGQVQRLLQEAQEAETLRQRIADIEAQQAAAAAQAIVTTPAPQPDDEWRDLDFDDAIRGLVKFDEKEQIFVPANPSSATHQQAAQEMNRVHGITSKRGKDLTFRPRSAMKALIEPILTEREKTILERLEKLEKSVEPVQTYVTQSQAAQVESQLIDRHYDELYTGQVDPKNGEPVLKPFGEVVHHYMTPTEYGGLGMAFEQAYGSAKLALDKLQPPAAPQEPSPTPPATNGHSSISKARQPNRISFASTVSPQTQQLAERPDSGELTAKKHMTEAEYRKKWGLLGNR